MSHFDDFGALSSRSATAGGAGGISVKCASSVGLPGGSGVSPEDTVVMLRRSSTLGNAAAATVYFNPACTWPWATRNAPLRLS